MASKEIIYNNTTYTLSYELVNPAQQASILILHGWGSNKEIMKQAFGKTLPTYKHIYLDMPGFGKSPNETVLTTEDYVKIVALFWRLWVWNQRSLWGTLLGVRSLRS